MKTLNRALALKDEYYPSLLEKKEVSPCIFLIHHSEVRQAAKAIGDYISQRGQVDIYLDLSKGMDIVAPDESFLQIFAEGFAWSSHVMILSSSGSSRFRSLTSLFEHLQKSFMPSSCLLLKDHFPFSIPSCLEILGGIKSLNEYLMRISPENNEIIFNNSDYNGLLAHTAPHHPLDAHLNWKD